MFNLEDIPLGGTTEDPTLQTYGKILRLLYLEDIKEIQQEINNLIESIQTFTTLAKTDTSLGRHGK